MLRCRSGILLLPPWLSAWRFLAVAGRGVRLSGAQLGLRRHCAAEHVDHHLVNAWGIAFRHGNAVIGDNGTDVATVYDGNGNASPVAIAIPQGAPTGVVANQTTDFIVSKGGKSGASRFIFAGEDGFVSAAFADVDATHAVLKFHARDGAIYKGLALAGSSGPHLYATDFHNGKIDVLNGAFNLVHFSGAFVDPSLPSGYGPFGISALLGKLIVTFAKQDAAREDDLHGKGLRVCRRLRYPGPIPEAACLTRSAECPVGIALAPDRFGSFGGRLLLGNFGDGLINAYDFASGSFLGALRLANGHPIVIDGLWGITFGNGVDSQSARTLFFAAGPSGESHGLYGRVDVVPGILSEIVSLQGFSYRG